MLLSLRHDILSEACTVSLGDIVYCFSGQWLLAVFPLRSTVVDCGSQAVADILENFFGNIKFPENSQPYTELIWCCSHELDGEPTCMDNEDEEVSGDASVGDTTASDVTDVENVCKTMGFVMCQGSRWDNLCAN